MRGSQWEGKGGPGLRLEWVLAVVAVAVVLSAVAAFFYTQGSPPASAGQEYRITTITTTGIRCGGPVPPSAQAVEQDPRFAQLAGGRCYNYMGENSSAGATTLTFDYYNGTVAYACGLRAEDLIAAQIRASTSSSTGATSFVEADNGTALNPAPVCPSTPPVAVVSVVDVGSLIPAVPQLNVTLAASPGAPLVDSLKATLTLNGTTQLFQFVAPPHTLATGEVSKTEIVSSTAPFTSSALYPMTIAGTFADGQTFSYEAFVQVSGVP